MKNDEILEPEELNEKETINFLRKIENLIFKRNDKSRNKIN